MQASFLSSSKQRTQTFVDDESFLTFFIVFDDFCSLTSFCSSVVTAVSPELLLSILDSDDVVISVSVLVEEFVSDDAHAACSRARISKIILESIIYF